MKILFLNTNLGYGGASKMLAWVANAATESGHESVFVTYRDAGNCQHLSSDVRWVHFNLESPEGGGKGMMNSVKVLRQFIKNERFDLAVGFLTPSQVRLSLACAGLTTKTLFSHRGDPNVKSGGLKGWLSRIAFRMGDYFVFQTPGAQKCFSIAIRNRSRVIPNPVTAMRRSSQRPDIPDKRIVCVARLDNVQKRQDILIEAFRIVLRKHHEYSLEFYGDGPDEEMLRGLATYVPSVIFKGKILNVAKDIENAAMFVLPSDFEGIPNALAEAMSLGIPCIATDCSPGGAALLIDSGKNGLLVPRGNVLELAEAITFMIEHPEEAESMGRTAREISLRFSDEMVKDSWLDFFSYITNDK